ncbi:MAG: hypothetical protein AAGD96_29650 [Chloroflexota bacterium]
MNQIYYLIIGVIIGWLVGFILDYFFWRNRQIEDDIKRELDQTQAENGQLAAEIFLLEDHLKHKKDEVVRLREQIATAIQSNLQTQMGPYAQKNVELESELATLRQKLLDCVSAQPAENEQQYFQQLLEKLTAAVQSWDAGDVTVQVGDVSQFDGNDSVVIKGKAT